MSETNPILAMLLESNSFVGAGPTVEHEIMPVDSQLNFGPGDVALLAGANTPLEHDFAVLQAMDPEQHAEMFPDWEERMLNSYVLCTRFASSDPELSLGWFSRVKILPISQEHYTEALTWLEHGFPEPLPDWCEDYHRALTDELAQVAPEVVPKAATCPGCGSRNVALIVRRRLKYQAKAGVIMHDGHQLWVPITEVEDESSHTAKLVCTECKSNADLGDDEWQLPGISN